MKTTVELNDHLLEATERYAARHRLTLRAVLESALYHFWQQQAKEITPFRMRRATFAGNGLPPGLQDGDWDRMRSRIYEDQGG